MTKKVRKLIQPKKAEAFTDKDVPSTLDNTRNSMPVSVSKSGKYLTQVGLDLFLTPKYAYCDSCVFAPANGGDCDEYIDGADCEIERNMFALLIQSLADDGVTQKDRLVVYGLAQDLFRMRRLNGIENELDWRKFYSDVPATKEGFLEELEIVMKMVTNNSKSYMQKLKELLGTRKEREARAKRGGKTIDNSFEFVMDLADDDEGSD